MFWNNQEDYVGQVLLGTLSYKYLTHTKRLLGWVIVYTICVVSKKARMQFQGPAENRKNKQSDPFVSE
jgi:hypothetical protein